LLLEVSKEARTEGGKEGGKREAHVQTSRDEGGRGGGREGGTKLRGREGGEFVFFPRKCVTKTHFDKSKLLR